MRRLWTRALAWLLPIGVLPIGVLRLTPDFAWVGPYPQGFSHAPPWEDA